MKTVELVFLVEEEELAALQRIVETAGLESIKELANNAFTLFEHAVAAVKAGRVIAFVDEEANSYKEFNMPVFLNLKRAKTVN